MNEDTTKTILENIEKVQTVVNRIDGDLARDRTDIQELTIRLGKLELQVEQMRKAMDQLPRKTQDKVADVVEPLMGQLDTKKIIKLTTIGFWEKLFKKGGK